VKISLVRSVYNILSELSSSEKIVEMAKKKSTKKKAVPA